MRIAAAPAFRNRSSNPYNALLYGALQEAGHHVTEFDPSLAGLRAVDVIHLHWPESALNKPRPHVAAGRSVQLLIALLYHRARGRPVVWTVHNVRSHFQRYPVAEGLWWRCFTRLLTGWISLTPGGADQAMAEHPRLREIPSAVIPHGHYRDAYPDVSRTEARGKLGLDDQPVLAFVGRVKPYKGVPQLLAAFAGLQDPQARLIIAGRCDEEPLARSIRDTSDSRVLLHLRELSDLELIEFIRAADVIVLPFREVLNSGSALLGLSFDSVLVLPRRGALPELATSNSEWLIFYDGEITTEVLARALRHPRPSGRPDLSGLEWSAIAGQTADFFAAQVRRAQRGVR